MGFETIDLAAGRKTDRLLSTPISSCENLALKSSAQLSRFIKDVYHLC